MKIVFYFVFVASNCLLCAQQNLSVLLDYSLSNRVDNQRQINSTKYLQKQYELSKYSLLPSSNISVNQSVVSAKVPDAYGNRTKSIVQQMGDYSFNVRLNIFSGFQAINKIYQNRTLADKGKSEQLLMENAIKLEVIQAYYGAMLLKENIRLAQNAWSTSQMNAKIANETMEAGKTSRLDYLEICALSEADHSFYCQAQQQYAVALAELKQAVNMPAGDTIVLPDNDQPVLDSSLYQTDSVYQRALKILPQFSVVKYDIQYWQYDSKISKSNFYPVLTTNAAIRSGFNQQNMQPVDSKLPFQQQVNDNLLSQVGVSLVIPIFNQYSVRTKVFSSDVNYQNSVLSKSQLEQELYNEIDKVTKAVRLQLERIRTLQKKQNLYNEIYEMRNEQIRWGKLSVYEFLQADTNKKRSEIELAIEWNNLLLNIKLLEFYSGRI